MAQPINENSPGLPNWKTPTLGGKQFWTDHQWREGWRIQQNAFTGHWRLLDAEDVRHAWGTQAACLAALDAAVPRGTVEGSQFVILLHGLGRSATSMGGLRKMLSQSMGCEIFCFEYASTRAPIGQHAEALTSVILGLPQGASVSFVGHSMGNIVVRRAIKDWQQVHPEILPRVEKVVMLGPPNQGSSIARLLSRTGLFGMIAGKGGLELGQDWQDFEASLATPHCPFGVIAGRLPEGIPDNPLVDGRGDFIVSVEETKLDGAADFMEVPRLHSFLMDDNRVQQAVLNFLETGKFAELPQDSSPGKG